MKQLLRKSLIISLKVFYHREVDLSYFTRI